MKKFSKLAVVTIFVLVLIISSLSFVACDKGEGILINDIALSLYDIVYDSDDLIAKHTAYILQQEIASLTGISLDVKCDSDKASKNEILVGNTSRSGMCLDIAHIDNDYAFGANEKKIILNAEQNYMIGGAALHLIGEIEKCLLSNQNLTIGAIESFTYEIKDANSVILMIGDGMGFNTIEMARQSGVYAHFSAESLPIKGEAVTRSYSVMTGDAEYTDSAAGATALATGYKTNNKVIGKDHEGNNVKNVRELAYENGAKTAIVTTDVLSGATPAAFYAHVANRGSDGLIGQALKKETNSGSLTYSYGFADDDLLDVSKIALDTISKDDSNFFIMIEEAYIDKTADDNDKDELMDIMQRWNDVIAYVIEFTLTHPGTVLIITADHETGGITLGEDGNYTFTTTNHTNVNVPVYAFGAGTEIFNGVATENIDIAKFIASVYSDEPFGGSLPAVA